jgi:hypothetical protein
MLYNSSVIMPPPSDPDSSRKLYGTIGELVKGEEGRKKSEKIGSIVDQHRRRKELLIKY